MFPELATNRLLLQQILPADQVFVFEGLSHPDVIPYYGVQYDSFQSTAAQMQWYEKLLEEGTGLAWKIVIKESGHPAGVISFYFYKPEHRKAEVGFWLMPECWGKGYAREALRAVVQYCQHQKGIHRIEAFVEDGNESSRKLLERSGFVCEGTMKDCERKHGKFISLHVYAILLSTEDYSF
jgi:ribosomal-protein-alanine N-acetyltransferase